jgi:hypothetical protein
MVGCSLPHLYFLELFETLDLKSVPSMQKNLGSAPLDPWVSWRAPLYPVLWAGPAIKAMIIDSPYWKSLYKVKGIISVAQSLF